MLCASDPYAAVGVAQAFGIEATFIAGRATCTDAGAALTEKLTGRPALNLLDDADWPRLEEVLNARLGVGASSPPATATDQRGMAPSTS